MVYIFTKVLKAVRTRALIGLVLLGNLIMCLCAWLFLHFEKATNIHVKSYWDALWWAICTVSTVGYGDIAPITLGGRLTGAFLIIVGAMFFLGFMAIVSSIVFTALVEKELHLQ